MPRRLPRKKPGSCSLLSPLRVSMLHCRMTLPNVPSSITDFVIANSLTWAYLQEKLTTKPYGPADAPEVWHFPVFLNTIQSVFAAIVGAVYLYASTPSNAAVPP